jgi:VWFA-related protein
MKLKTNGLWAAALWTGLIATLSAQAPAPARPATGNPQDVPTFRVTIDAVTMDVIVKDDQGRFIPDLAKDDFEIYEDGVKQDIASMTMSHGGRVTNVLEAPAPSAPEGVILPTVRRINDTSGRIFIFFLDDLHLQFQGTGRVREIFKKIERNLIHDGDLFGIVSSGPSSLSIDLTYDKKRLMEAIEKMTGDGMKPSDIISMSNTAGGPTELRHRAHVAFSTMIQALNNLEKVHDRRKALVWVSEGYDFTPFQKSRLGLFDSDSPFIQNSLMAGDNQVEDADGNIVTSAGGLAQYQQQSETFSDADLSSELYEITRAANRANTTIYSIDPRGLVAGGDIEEQVDPREWNMYVQKSQETLRTLAEETGGVAVVNQNDFDKALKRIDAESSDYYVLGYYSSNPDPTKRRRTIEVKVNRPKVDLTYRTEYVIRTPSRAPAPAANTTRP